MYDDVAELLREIAAGEDTYLEFKEVRFQGDKVRFASEEGKAASAIADVLEYVLVSPYAAIRSTKSDMGRLDQPRYSPVALQESIVNALVHRDYELTGSQVIVYVFPDRIEVRNPGGLHNTLTPENLYAGCQPIRRNQHMAGFLRDFKSSRTGHAYMEMRGEGFLTVLRESRRLSGRWPELKVVGQSVSLTLFGASDERSDA